MELILRLAALLMTPFAFVLKKLCNWLVPQRKPTYPPIRNKLLTKSVTELVQELRRKQLKSETLVSAYIERLKEVNPALNAIVEQRYAEAIKEAQKADALIAQTKNDFDLVQLFTRHPLLGIPFTVKESCAVKDLSFAVGSLVRKKMKAPRDGDTVAWLRSAGCIPLLVSANPEFCLSFETNTPVHGKCVNPYDLRRTSGGSSGGEGALNGAGASPFGLASDISGSIRLPAMFCGVYGHKPTGGLVSVKGHFPNSKDPKFPFYLQMGPITRFARDLPILLQTMAGDKAHKLRFEEPVKLRDLKIYYAYGFSGFNGITHPHIDFEIKLAITRAVKCFEKINIETKELDLSLLSNSMEMALISLIDLKGIPSIITQNDDRPPSKKLLVLELLNSLIGHSIFTKEALFIELMKRLNGFFIKSRMERYRQEAKQVKLKLSELLGTNGVLFLPTFHTSATCFHTSLFNLSGIDSLLLFNMLGFPATHVTMGLNDRNMPIGFQVVANEYQDKLCIQVAAELEGAFGGWVPPVPHDFAD